MFLTVWCTYYCNASLQWYNTNARFKTITLPFLLQAICPRETCLQVFNLFYITSPSVTSNLLRWDMSTYRCSTYFTLPYLSCNKPSAQVRHVYFFCLGAHIFAHLKECTKRKNWTELNWTELKSQFTCIARTVQSVQFISVQFGSVQFSLFHLLSGLEKIMI